MRYGMDKTLGQVSYEPEQAAVMETPGSADWHVRRYGEATAEAIDAAVRTLIGDAFQRAVAILGGESRVARPVGERVADQGNVLVRRTEADRHQTRTSVTGGAACNTTAR